MASTFTHVSSSNLFPRHRVQKLLSRALYSGLTTKIEAEGIFIQVAEDGFPVRQVFLAVTEREIFIVKQVNYISKKSLLWQRFGHIMFVGISVKSTQNTISVMAIRYVT